MDDIKEGYTRVTEMLWHYGSMHNIPKHILQKAADRGSRVHSSIQAFLYCLPIYLEDDTLGYFDSFKKWWLYKLDKVNNPVACMEKRFYCEELKITGQADLILGDKTHTIIDFKTSASYSPTWEMQGTAYKYLANKAGYNVDKVIFLKLDRDGNDPVEYEIKDDYETFLKCYELYQKFFQTKVFKFEGDGKFES